MELHGIKTELKHKAPLEETFIPMKKWNEAYLAEADKPFAIAVERNDGFTSVYKTKIRDTADSAQADYLYASKLVKMMLWARGGWKIYVCGNSAIAQAIAADYSETGERAFDYELMGRIYEHTFEVVDVAYEECPEEKESAEAIGQHLNGCRIGFDAGGSDRKVSAVIDGETVYSEEVIWYPKLTADPEYHYEGIVESFKTAASKMPRVDGIGVSSAGIYISNRTREASLFLSVPRDEYYKVEDIYQRAADAVAPGVPLVVANDGDVTALAGAMSLNEGNIMGIAMGTSEAVGFVDDKQNIAGWLNELAFAPVDYQENATQDEWSHDYGVGCKYLSQDAAIRLAEVAGLEIDPELPLATKLKEIQGFMENDDPRAQQIFESIGVYLAHTLAAYTDFYDIHHVILMGRVVSGKGGDLALQVCQEVMAEEYPEIAQQMEVMLPDDKLRRVGQSMAAASLPNIQV